MILPDGQAVARCNPGLDNEAIAVSLLNQ